MKRPPRPGFLLVAARELRWMRRDRIALFLALGVPLIAFALLAFTFSNPVIRDLRVSVVDDDRSSTSRTYIQAIASAPGVRVAERSTDLTAQCTRFARAKRSPPSTSRPISSGTFNRRSGRRSSSLQQAVSHAREQCFERALWRDQRGDSVAGQVGTVLDLSSRRHRHPAVHAHQSRPQLCAVSASGDPAHRSAHRGRGNGRLRCRLGVLLARSKGMAQGRGG